MSLVGELKQGDFAGALHKIAGWFESGVSDVESQFPILGQFISQFSSDLGQKLLADAEALAPAVIAGTTSMGSAASQLLSQAGSQAASIATTDATNLALNALRVYVSAPNAAAVAANQSAAAT